MEEEADIYWDEPPWYDRNLPNSICGAISDAYKTVCRVLGGEARGKGYMVSLAPTRFETSDEVDQECCLIKAIAFLDNRLLPNFSGSDRVASLMKEHCCERQREQLAFVVGFFEKFPPVLWSEDVVARVLGRAWRGRGKHYPSEKELLAMRKGWDANKAPGLTFDIVFPLRLLAVFDDEPLIRARWDIDYDEESGALIEMDRDKFSRDAFGEVLANAGLRFLREADRRKN